MSAGTTALVIVLGSLILVTGGAALWAFVDNRWLYRGRIPSKDDHGGFSAPDPHQDTKWWFGGGSG